jgi:hypothetical protein
MNGRCRRRGNAAAGNWVPGPESRLIHRLSGCFGGLFASGSSQLRRRCRAAASFSLVDFLNRVSIRFGTTTRGAYVADLRNEPSGRLCGLRSRERDPHRRALRRGSKNAHRRWPGSSGPLSFPVHSAGHRPRRRMPHLFLLPWGEGGREAAGRGAMALVLMLQAPHPPPSAAPSPCGSPRERKRRTGEGGEEGRIGPRIHPTKRTSSTS